MTIMLGVNTVVRIAYNKCNGMQWLTFIFIKLTNFNKLQYHTYHKRQWYCIYYNILHLQYTYLIAKMLLKYTKTI